MSVSDTEVDTEVLFKIETRAIFARRQIWTPLLRYLWQNEQ